jgi:hypothetical protein
VRSFACWYITTTKLPTKADLGRRLSKRRWISLTKAYLQTRMPMLGKVLSNDPAERRYGSLQIRPRCVIKLASTTNHKIPGYRQNGTIFVFLCQATKNPSEKLNSSTL